MIIKILRGDVLRSEQEMFDLIIGIAKADERVRAVYMKKTYTKIMTSYLL